MFGRHVKTYDDADLKIMTICKDLHKCEYVSNL